MAIDFSDPAVIMSGGRPIPIDTQSEYDAAVQAATQIYSARPGGSFDSGALADLENRIRGGQTLDDIIKNTYDDARRRFPESSAADLASRDAALNLGRQYTPTSQETAHVITTAGIPQTTVAAAMSPSIPSRQIAEQASPQRQLATQTARPMMNAGPASMVGPMRAGVLPGGGMNMGTLIMLAGAGILAFVLFRKML